MKLLIIWDVKFTIGELDFNHDPEFIKAYQNSDRFYDRDFEDYINDRDDNDNNYKKLKFLINIRTLKIFTSNV